MCLIPISDLLSATDFFFTFGGEAIREKAFEGLIKVKDLDKCLVNFILWSKIRKRA